MSDLTKRLRATNKRVRHSQELRDEAADYIDKLQGALESIYANSAPYAVSLSAENRIKAFYAVACKALGKIPDHDGQPDP